MPHFAQDGASPGKYAQGGEKVARVDEQRVQVGPSMRKVAQVVCSQTEGLRRYDGKLDVTSVKVKGKRKIKRGMRRRAQG